MIRLSPSRARGFSLLEVLVALIIISIGVLGVAAIQATALSGTHSSQTESLVAIQARSLADAMEANTAYWASGSLPAQITVTPASSVAATISPAIAIGSCASSVCTASQMAAYDLNAWGAQLYSQVPGVTNATITCNGAPISCTISVNWQQKATIASNGGTRSTTAATQMNYTLVNQL